MRRTILATLVCVGFFAASGTIWADPEDEGRVKVQMPTEQTDSTVDDLQGIVVLCADGTNSCNQPKATGGADKPHRLTRGKKSRENTSQHNQSDLDFIRERAN